jgi:hypothetical protein
MTTKPTIYLDQNVYDKIRRNSLDGFIDYLNENYTTIYSDETIVEMLANKNLSTGYLSILKSLDCKYMEIELTDKHRITDKARFVTHPVDKIVEMHNENENESAGVYEGIMDFGNKLVGGFKEQRFDQLIEKQKESLNNLLVNLENQLDSFDEPHRSILYRHIQAAKESYPCVFDELSKTINDKIPDQENYSGSNDFRKAVKLGPRELQNIRTPNVVRKIWDLIRENEQIKSANLSIEKFFGIDTNPIYPNEDYPTYSKIISMFSVLNTIGYYPDKEIEKPNKYSGAQIDARHIANAIFCSGFLSFDQRLIKKGEAIYEFFNLGTVIFKE